MPITVPVHFALVQGALANACCFFTARERCPTALLGHAVPSDALNADNFKWLKNPIQFHNQGLPLKNILF